MRIAGASRGWRRREHYQGGIGRRPLSRPSSAFVLLGRPTPGLVRVRGAREVDAFSVALFSRPRGMGQAGLRASAPVSIRPGRRRGSARTEEHLATRPASRWAHSDEPCSSPRLDEVRDFNRRRAQHIVSRRSQLRKHLTEEPTKAARESADKKRRASRARPCRHAHCLTRRRSQLANKI